MARTKSGFSLIETLVAIIIASISVLALMQVVSRSSNASANLLRRFDTSLVLGLFVSDINESLHFDSMNAYDLLAARYNIDHPAIKDTLKQTSYQATFSSKEMIDPLVTTNLNILSSVPVTKPIGIQKILIHNNEEKKSFFHLTAGY